MLQIQQQLIDELEHQLSSNQPSPEDLSTWAEHPATLYFLNKFRLGVLEFDDLNYGGTDDRKLWQDVGYSDAVSVMEETIEGFRKMTEGDDDE